MGRKVPDPILRCIRFLAGCFFMNRNVTFEDTRVTTIDHARSCTESKRSAAGSASRTIWWKLLTWGASSGGLARSVQQHDGLPILRPAMTTGTNRASARMTSSFRPWASIIPTRGMEYEQFHSRQSEDAMQHHG